MDETLQAILSSGIVAIIRSDNPVGLVEAARALARGGIPAIEVTMTTPGALEAIASLAKQAAGEFIIGAGSVVDAGAARAAIDAGAAFLVAPNVDLAVIREARRRRTVVCPGALTPTEVALAWRAGADIVKVFPASSVGGPAYIRALKAPLPQVRLMPVGGVDASNTASYIRAGACAVGVGSSLVNAKRIAAADWDGLAAAARQYVDAVAEARSPSPDPRA